jgi:alanine racemase
MTMQDYFEGQPGGEEIHERMEGYPSWMEIDLDAITHNLEQIRGKTGAEVVPCLKTNAYGHGLVPMAAHLNQMGVERVLVAKLWEARQIRMADLNCGIINLDPLFSREDRRWVVENQVTQTIYQREAGEMLSRVAMDIGETVSIWVKVDTGLGRVGVRYMDAPDMIEHLSGLPGLELEGIFSTLSEDPELDLEQVKRLKEVDSEIRERGINPGTRSIASSNAIFHRPSSYLDAVRPGLSLMGYYPEPGDRGKGINLHQSLTFKARLEHVKTVEAGESLTYSRRFTAPKTMKVGTLHIGYSDGYPRELTNKGLVRVMGEIKPVLGTISVNHLLVDLENTQAQIGDPIEAISSQGENSLEALSIKAGIMPYKLCVGLNPLTPRIYLREGRPVALSEPKLVQ